MLVNEISIGVENNDYYKGIIQIGDFNLSLKCISEMYWRYLKVENTKTKSLQKLNLRFDKEYSYSDKIVGIVTITTPFNFSNFFSLDNYGKKKLILESIHESFLRIADQQEIDKSKLQEAYNYCLQNNLENRWLVGGKTIRSLSKKYNGCIECYWELDFFQATAIIYDKTKHELKRELLFKELSNAAIYNYYIYYIKPTWLEKDGKEVFVFNPKNMLFEETKKDYWEIDPE